MWNRISQNPRTAVLGGVLVGLLTTVFAARQSPFLPPSLPAATSSVTYQSRSIPKLIPVQMGWTARQDTHNSRNPFSYRAVHEPQAPTGSTSATTENTRPPTERTPIRQTVPRVETAAHEYLGYVGPFRRPFAVFRHGGEIELAVAGQALDGGYVLRSFDETAAVFTHTVDGKRRKVRVVVAER